MAKILFCVNRLSLGGVERRLSQLIRGLYKLQKYSLYCIINNKDRLLEPEVEKYVNFITIYPNVPKNILVKHYREIIYKIKPDIVHCWTMKQCEIINEFDLQTRNNFIYLCGAVNSAYKYKDGSRHKAIMDDCIIKSNIIISNSNAGLRAKCIPLRKARIIKNGYNFERITHIDCSLIDNNIITKISHYEHIILMACRICIEKDIRMFVDLARHLNISKKYLFLLAGDGNLCGEDFKNLIRESSNILYLGYRRDIDALIKLSNVCVLFSNPPHEEGISNFIIEAMAQGKPVIATEGGGTNEIIISGDNGFLVKPHDYESVINVIEYLCSNVPAYAKICRQALCTIINRFNFCSMLKEYDNLYTTLLQGIKNQ